MGAITHTHVRANGISMHVAEAGPPDGKPVICCHGFPELWWSWRHQLPALARAGYRAIAPDQRGYGGTDRPDRIEDYDIHHLAGDMLGLLDAIGAEKAVFVGHDWGAPVVWHLAIAHPERVEAVCGMSVPFTPRGTTRPTELWKRVFGDTFFYILYFQQPGIADAELGGDARTTMTKMLCAIAEGGSMRVLPREGTGFLDQMPDVSGLPAWLTQDELDVFVAEFERTGFTGGLNWYRNFDRNWETTAHLSDAMVTRPALFVAGASDPVIRMASPDAMKEHVTDLRGSVIIDGAGHWVQQEKPGEVNRALLEFLAGLP